MERITVVKIGGNVIDNPAAMKRFLNIKNRTFYPHTGFRIKQKTSLFCTKVTLDVLDRSYGQMDLWSIRS